MTVPATSSVFSYRTIVAAVWVVGIVVSAISYREGRSMERERAEAEFVHRAALQHALTREILGHYEDALFGLSTLFTLQAHVTHEEFARAAGRLAERIAGVQAFEWVPVVTNAERAAVEAAQRRAQPEFEISELGTDGVRRRAAERPVYYPILYVYPLRGNEAAVGYDLLTGPTRSVLERARVSREALVSPSIRLVQEKGDQPGVVMILPVFRVASASPGQPAESLAGFLQCVFRVHDLLAPAYRRQPEPMLDMLFLDRSEPDPARRTLYYHPSSGAPGAVAPTEQEFGSKGPSREYKIPFGERDWRVVFRPQAGWMEQRRTSMPVLRSVGLLLLSGLLAGLVHILGRRAQTIQRQVDERTAELAESRQQIANMLHALPGMSFRCAYDGRIEALFVSEGARELTGWSAEEFTAGAVHFRDCIHPDDIGRVRAATRQALDGRQDIELDYRVRTKSGEEKWVLSRGRGICAEDGARVFEGLVIDVTAQKKAEIARLDLERKMLEGQKLESLGLLAGGIAHDFNNLLSGILGNASMARLSLPPGNALDEQLRAIETASLRAAELCRQMLAYAGKGRFVIEPTELTALTEDLLPLLKISIAHQATLTLDLARGLPSVLADATQIRQTVMNLVLNAADAITDRAGEIVLSTGVMQAERAMLATCVAGADLPAGEYVFLEVRDTGAGMTAETMAKMFDPFFTTKFAGRGLGLAAVLGIVRGHHGALRVESTPGVGSSFRLMLPPVKVAALRPKPPQANSSDPWLRGGSVLVVDDEEQVRTVLVAMLKVYGFAATPAADGQSGLALFRENPTSFDLVVLDLLMPGMNGEQTFRALRAIKPDVRVLIVSGFSEGDILGRLGGGRALGFLAKPFTRAALERKLRELLA